MSINLLEYGFNETYLANISFSMEGYRIGRVFSEHKSVYGIVTEFGEMTAKLSGKYIKDIDTMGGKPTVGDFVKIKTDHSADHFSHSKEGQTAIIYDYLPRKSYFVRSNGFSRNCMQVLAANFDTIFICMSLNNDLNLSRLERYLLSAKSSGAETVVVLTKADLPFDNETIKQQLYELCGEVRIISVSAKTGYNMDLLKPYLTTGKTVVALGSSGVGKSSLINAVCGSEIMNTAEIREDDSKGRHTTTHRQLIKLPSGGLYLDTPGIRELGLFDIEESMEDYFSDIEELVTNCRFSDCKHAKEPGCAVKAAIHNKTLTTERFEKYAKYKKESSHTKIRTQYQALRSKRIKSK